MIEAPTDWKFPYLAQLMGVMYPCRTCGHCGAFGNMCQVGIQLPWNPNGLHFEHRTKDGKRGWIDPRRNNFQDFDVPVFCSIDCGAQSFTETWQIIRLTGVTPSI